MFKWYKRQQKAVKIAIAGAAAFWIIFGITEGVIGYELNHGPAMHRWYPPAQTKYPPAQTTTQAGRDNSSVVSAPTPPPAPAPTPEPAPATYKAACQTIGFRVLDKNPSAYEGQKYKVQGQVVQILESAGETVIRLNVDKDEYGLWDDTIYVSYDDTTPALEKSIINIYGEVTGPYSYTSQAGWDITLPMVKAKYIEVVQQ